MLRDVGLEIRSNCGEAGLAGERFVEAEERQDHVGLLRRQVRRGVAEVERPRLQRQRVAAPAQVAHRQLELREQREQRRLEVVEVLLPFGERVADEDHAVVRLEREARLRRRRQREGEQERDRNRQRAPAGSRKRIVIMGAQRTVVRFPATAQPFRLRVPSRADDSWLSDTRRGHFAGSAALAPDLWA